MSKGTSSFGKRSRKQKHVICRRCGEKSFNVQKGKCSNCGFGESKKREDSCL